MCDDVALMDAGAVIARGAVAALVATLCGPQAELVVIAAADVAGDAVLARAGFVNGGAGVWSRPGDGSAGELAAVERRLADAAVPVLELRLRRPTLAGALAAAVHQSRLGTGVRT